MTSGHVAATLNFHSSVWLTCGCCGACSRAQEALHGACKNNLQPEATVRAVSVALGDEQGFTDTLCSTEPEIIVPRGLSQ